MCRVKTTSASADNVAPVVDAQTQSGRSPAEIRGAQEVPPLESEKPGSGAVVSGPEIQEPQRDAIAPAVAQASPSSPPEPVAKDAVVEQSMSTSTPQQSASGSNEPIAVDPTPSPHSSEDTVVGSEPIFEQPGAENSPQPGADAPEEPTQTQAESVAIDEHHDHQQHVTDAADEPAAAGPITEATDAPAAETETHHTDSQISESPLPAAHHESVEAKDGEQSAAQPTPTSHTGECTR